MFRQLPDKVQIDVNLNLNLTVNVPFQTAVFTTLFNQFQEAVMSQFSDLLNEVKAAAQDALQRSVELQATFADLKAKVDAGLATPEDLETLKQIKPLLDGIDPRSPVVIPEPTPEPAPEPAPEG